MLTVQVTLHEGYDESSGEFVPLETHALTLEHSLASLSKWESHYEKPFLGKTPKTTEEVVFYVQNCMLLDENPPEGILQKLSEANFQSIQTYLDSKASATTVKRPPTGNNRQILTAEVIYAWMVGLRIPFETQYWHLNRLLMLIDVVNEQQKPPKKMGRADAARQQASLNAQRRAQMSSRG